MSLLLAALLAFAAATDDANFAAAPSSEKAAIAQGVRCFKFQFLRGQDLYDLRSDIPQELKFEAPDPLAECVMSGDATRVNRTSSTSFGDFNAYWTAGRLFLQKQNNYDPHAVESINTENRLPSLFVVWNPPWLFPLLAPFSAVPFPMAGILWLAMNVLLALACAHAIGRRVGLPDFWAWILGFTYVPVGICLGFSQLSILALAGAVGYLVARERGRPVLSGAALVLASFKPHIVCLLWLLPLLTGSKSERIKTLLGLAASLGTLTLIAVAWHPALLGNYWDALRHPPETPPTGYYSATLGMWLRMESGMHEHVWMQFVPFVLGAVGFAAYLIRRGHERIVFDLVLSALALSGIVLPYGWHFDQSTLMPIYLSLWAAVLFRSESRPAWPYRLVLVSGLLALQFGQLAMFIAGTSEILVHIERWHVVWPLMLTLLYAAPPASVGLPRHLWALSSPSNVDRLRWTK